MRELNSLYQPVLRCINQPQCQRKYANIELYQLHIPSGIKSEWIVDILHLKDSLPNFFCSSANGERCNHRYYLGQRLFWWKLWKLQNSRPIRRLTDCLQRLSRSMLNRYILLMRRKVLCEFFGNWRKWRIHVKCR